MARIHYNYEIRDRLGDLLVIATSQKDMAKQIKKHLGTGVFNRVQVYKVIRERPI